MFDAVPEATAVNVFTPLPVARPRNSFDEVLPRELRLHIFAFMVELHEEEHADRLREGKWTAMQASRHRWVGRDEGIRALVRLSRVCELLVYDKMRS